MTQATTILIVDDQEHNRLILNDQVVALGHKPLLAENGLSALAQVGKNPPRPHLARHHDAGAGWL